MKNLKKGFTLAEILIALGIVSIIGALTLPQVTVSAERRKSGAILSRIYSQFENAAIQLIFNYNHNESGGLFTDKIALTGNNWQDRDTMVRRLRLTPLSNDNNTYKFDKLPGQIQFVIPDVQDADRYLDGTRVLTITVDTNGFNKGPNTNGVDRFAFYLANNGKMHPDNAVTRNVVLNNFKVD